MTGLCFQPMQQMLQVDTLWRTNIYSNSISPSWMHANRTLGHLEFGSIFQPAMLVYVSFLECTLFVYLEPFDDPFFWSENGLVLELPSNIEVSLGHQMEPGKSSTFFRRLVQRLACGFVLFLAPRKPSVGATLNNETADMKPCSD